MMDNIKREDVYRTADASEIQLDACAPISDDERIDLVAERILSEYLEAFKELAK